MNPFALWLWWLRMSAAPVTRYAYCAGRKPSWFEVRQTGVLFGRPVYEYAPRHDLEDA